MQKYIFFFGFDQKKDTPHLDLQDLNPIFLSDPGVHGVGPWVRLSLTSWVSETPFANLTWLDLTDVTLADEDTNSILTYNANRAIQGNVAMQIIQSGWQLEN